MRLKEAKGKIITRTGPRRIEHVSKHPLSDKLITWVRK